MTDESVLDEMLSAGDYEIVMCVLFAEVLAGEMTEQYRNLRMEALMHLRSVLAQYQKRMYHDKLLSGIASKKGKMILKATSKAEINRILHPKAPHFDGAKFIPDEYSVAEEELICWSEASLKAPLVTPALHRYMELFRKVFPEESKRMSPGEET